MLLAAEMVCDIDTISPYGSEPRWIAGVNGTAFFVATTVSYGTELWKSDGTETGTVIVKDINPGSASGFNPYLDRTLVDVNGTLFFPADDGVHGVELWKSNGTEAGTVMVKDIYVGPNSSMLYSFWLINVNGTSFFTADDGSTGYEIWKSNGTEAGTVLVKDLWPGSGPGASPPSAVPPVSMNGTLFFVGTDFVTGWEVWKSDGTAAGTSLIKDIYPEFDLQGIWPAELTSINSALFFRMTDGINGEELWKSDGTPEGTVMVADINPDYLDSSPYSLTNVNGTLFFGARNQSVQAELWKSDGTTAGTVLVKDIWPGEGPSWPEQLANVGGTLFFNANDPTRGRELFRSDGTAAGTVLVQDINPGSAASGPMWLTSVNGTVFFTANDTTHGWELWKSVGTAVGTVMVHDICLGTGSSSPSSIALVNGALFFSADDGVHGSELWRLPLTRNWDGGGDGASWSDPLNWADNTLPGPPDDVVISVSGTPTINLVASVTIRSLVCDETIAMAPGSGVLRAGSLQLGPTAQLDLSDNALIVDYADISPVGTIRGYLSSGYASGAWNGLGINSSIAAATPNRAVGYAQATDIGSPSTFAGQAIDDTAVLVRFTVSGDTNLDGKVDVADLGRLASNWQQSPRTFSQGDFDYSGSVDVNDLGILASNWQQSITAAPAERGPTSMFSKALPRRRTIRFDLDELLA
jgi:ELWxxDGT repeat protein